MDLEIINAMTAAGQQYLQYLLGIAGCASSADQIKKFFETNLLELNPTYKFYSNMYKFFKVGLSEEDKQILIDKLSDDDDGKRFFAIMREIDTDKTLSYILNATKALLNDEITLSIYFRICHVVINTLEEDLQFLKAHINEEKVPYSIEVGGLIVLGLTYHTGVNEDNIPEYGFTALAKLVNRYVINGDALNKIEMFNLNDPEQNVFFMTHAHITEEDIESIFDGTYEISKKAKT